MVKDFNDLPACLQVKDVAEVLGVSKVTAYRLTKEEGFPSVRVNGKRIIIPRDRFQGWLNRQAEMAI